MIGYTCVGTNNLEKAVQFYGGLFSLISAKPFFKGDRGLCAQDEGAPGARG